MPPAAFVERRPLPQSVSFARRGATAIDRQAECHGRQQQPQIRRRSRRHLISLVVMFMLQDRSEIDLPAELDQTALQDGLRALPGGAERVVQAEDRAAR